MIAEVRFLVDEAPQHLLVPGAKFELYEGKNIVARGEVLKANEIRMAEGTFLRQRRSVGFVARVTVEVSITEKPTVSVNLEGDQWTTPTESWKAAAIYGASYALEVVERKDCAVRILKILGTIADSNATVIAAAAADAVWKALNCEPHALIRSEIEAVALGSWKAEPDKLREFRRA